MCLSYTIFEGVEEQCKEQDSYCFPQSAIVSVMVNLQELLLDVTVSYSCCLHFKGEAQGTVHQGTNFLKNSTNRFLIVALYKKNIK